MGDVHLRDLRYFVAVAEEGSFTKAATERLFVSQPALSKQIRQLESRLRAELFTRSARSVTLTPAGEALLPRAKELLAGWEAALAAVTSAAEAARRTLTVGLHARTPPDLPAAVARVVDEQLPGYRVEFRQVSWDDPATGLVGELVDLAVAWLPVRDGQGLSARIVAREERWVAMPAGHRLASHTEVEFAELEDEPFVALPIAAGPMREFWLAVEQRSAPVRIAAEAHTAEEMFGAVAAGTGLVLLSATNAARYRWPGVVCRRVRGLPPAELAVLWRSADRRPAVRVVADACARHIHWPAHASMNR
ncbi:LysR family transcriptional regulator [Pseudonocardia thermophila]|uniref:LysR family transcriptional regulator n=1 Tax=Pseudonocardia thermophila TaxID=1848 RepID=UPI00248DC417|nr:LysR family transcriptional regulator [Pseudonocardia thermophila]